MASLSTTLPFLAGMLLSTVFLVASAGGGDVRTVCAKTPYPEFCKSSITVHPDAKTAEDVQELVYWAVNSGYNFAAKASMATNRSTDPGTATCRENFDWACKDLSLAIKSTPTTTMIKDVLNLLDATKKKNVEWKCEKCLGGKSVKDAGAISKGNDLEKMMEVLFALANPK